MNNYKNLYQLGWNQNLEKEFSKYSDNYCIGRVVSEYKNIYKLCTENGEILGTVSGKLNYFASDRASYPVVGDWVILEKFDDLNNRTIIHKILTRKSKFSRKVAGSVIGEQIMAVNIDFIFICMSLNNDFSIRRLERYTTTAFEGGAIPVILLTKADLCHDINSKIHEVELNSIGISVHIVSSANDVGINLVKQYLKVGITAAFLGSSGVGKSTLINKLYGSEILETGESRIGDDKGRHTTTNRELLVLPSGGIVIDTPGMREFQIWNAEEGIETSFEDIEKLALSCKFSDCTHTSEPSCAVRSAIEDGTLTQGRFNNYIKLKKEAEFIARKTSKTAQSEYHKKIKTTFKSYKSQFNRP